MCLPTRGPCRHGIDMSLTIVRSRSDARRHHWLLAFTALFSRSGSPTSAPVTEVRGRADVEATRTRVGGRERPAGSSVGVKRLHRSGPRSSGKPACGATDETTGVRCACQTGATSTARTRSGSAVRRGTLADPRQTTVTRAHFRLPIWSTWVPVGHRSVAVSRPRRRTAPRRRRSPGAALRFESHRPVVTRASTQDVPDGDVVVGHVVRRRRGPCAPGRTPPPPRRPRRPVVEVGDRARDEPFGRVRVQRRPPRAPS